MKNRIRNFMQGRNGVDHLARAQSLLGCGLAIVSLLVPGMVKLPFWAASMVLLVLCYVRMFSRNIYKRRAENQRYLQWVGARRQAWQQAKTRWQQRKDYRFFRCSSCRTWLRVPRGKGRIQMTCPKCKNTYIRKS